MKAQNNVSDKEKAKFMKNVQEYAAKHHGAKAQTQPVQAEPKPIGYQPPKEEITLSAVQSLVYMLTGQTCQSRPNKVIMPEGTWGRVCLVLSSQHNLYYRVTPDSCTCQGWFFSSRKYGAGKCRHHTLAFPEEAAKNCQIIADLKLGKQCVVEETGKSAPSTMPEKLEAVKLALEQGGIPYKSIVQDCMGQETILIKMPYAEDLTPDQAKKMDRALTLGRAAVGTNDVYVSAY